MRYDMAIIGSGPAGVSAAINAKIRNKNIIVFGSKELSTKISKAPQINNYVGFPQITGKDLNENFKAHLAQMGIEITEKKVNNVYAMGDYFALMSNNEMIEATTVVLATGVEFTKPIKGEDEYVGRGVGYCATCDAILYKDKTVAIVGYNKEAEEEANYLNELAAKVYYIPMYRDEAHVHENIEIIKERPVEVKGEMLVNELVFKDMSIKVDGVFFIKDSVSPNHLMPGLEMESAHIKVDKNMQTNISGCYAAGDITGKPYQYMKSTGEGLVAAQNAVSYLDKK